jgi:hypothetical protein
VFEWRPLLCLIAEDHRFAFTHLLKPFRYPLHNAKLLFLFVTIIIIVITYILRFNYFYVCFQSASEIW